MTIWEAVTGRPSGSMAVAIESIIVCIGGITALVYALAKAQLSQPFPQMIGSGLSMLAIAFYARSLHLAVRNDKSAR